MNAYQVLQVGEKATQTEILEAYQRLHAQYNIFTSPTNIDRFMEISAAYALLSNPEARAAIDRNFGHVPTVIRNPQTGQAGYRSEAFSPPSSTTKPLGRDRQVHLTNITHNHYYGSEFGEFSAGGAVRNTIIFVGLVSLLVPLFALVMS